MDIYHIEMTSDNENESHDLVAKRKVDIVQAHVEAVGGKVAVSRGFGLVPAIIVLRLPSDQKPETFFPDVPAKLIGEEDA